MLYSNPTQSQGISSVNVVIGMTWRFFELPVIKPYSNMTSLTFWKHTLQRKNCLRNPKTQLVAYRLCLPLSRSWIRIQFTGIRAESGQFGPTQNLSSTQFNQKFSLGAQLILNKDLRTFVTLAVKIHELENFFKQS